MTIYMYLNNKSFLSILYSNLFISIYYQFNNEFTSNQSLLMHTFHWSSVGHKGQ